MSLLKPASIKCWSTVAGILLLAFVPAAKPSDTATEKGRTARETDLKAVFLFNFAHFVDWPTNTFADETAPFVIGVIGDDPFGKSLDEVVANETLHNHRIIVRRYHDAREISACQILFICPSESTRLSHIFDLVAGKNILTVGENDPFTAHGGMICFVTAQNRLHLRINLDAATAAGLTISSQLLRQAEIVQAGQEH